MVSWTLREHEVLEHAGVPLQYRPRPGQLPDDAIGPGGPGAGSAGDEESRIRRSPPRRSPRPSDSPASVPHALRTRAPPNRNITTDRLWFGSLLSDRSHRVQRMRVELRPPGPADEPALRRLHRQLGKEGFDFLLAKGAWPDILAEYARDAVRDQAPGQVPADFLVASVDDQVIGRTSIRHRLNAKLLERGGHIGYAVGAEFRGRGYAQEILRLAVERLAALGVQRVLVTCDDVNGPSAAVIERCGGQLEDTRPAVSGALTRRYWIESRP